MTDEYDPIAEHRKSFDERVNSDTAPAPPVPSASVGAERDQLERKNRLLHGEIAKLEGRIARLEATERRLTSIIYKAESILRAELMRLGYE